MQKLPNTMNVSRAPFRKYPYKCLERSIEFNKIDNVYTYDMALGDTVGLIWSSDIINSNDRQNSVSTNGDGIKIPMCRLDDLPINEEKIALLKIDVEGYEKFVLHGARRLIERTDVIYFESGDAHYLKYGYRCSELFELLIEWGFELFRIIRETTISPVRSGYVANDNILAVRDIRSFCKRTSYEIEE